MEGNTYTEISYPVEFREEDAKTLGDALRMRHSVEIVGIKRIGISNFLRFFLYQPEVVTTYISKTDKHIFIPVDLNDLVERELFAFWVLTFKRLVDTVEISITLPEKTKREISELFLDAIQSRDMFLTIEGLRKALYKLTQQDHFPTIFFIRFDRITDALTPEFFANLAGIRESIGHKIAYIFTSFRTIEELMSEAHAKQYLSILTPLYLKPTNRSDMHIIVEHLEKRYHITPDSKLLGKLLDLSGGYVQYVQLGFVMVSQKKEQTLTKENLEELLLSDERILLQSEEIWESLTPEEQQIVLKIQSNQTVTESEKQSTQYLWNTGFVYEQNGKNQFFSSLFEHYLTRRNHEKKTNGESIDFTKKEHALFTLLQKSLNDVCEREDIIKEVWPEVEILGVSDWTIDRLVARLRTKLKKQNSKYSIITVKTRGYKLVEE